METDTSYFLLYKILLLYTYLFLFLPFENYDYTFFSYIYTLLGNVNANHLNGFTNSQTNVSNDLEAQKFYALFTNKELQVSNFINFYFYIIVKWCFCTKRTENGPVTEDLNFRAWRGPGPKMLLSPF